MASLSVYEWFRHVTSVVPWPREEDRRAAFASIQEWEEANIFGQTAVKIECQHLTLTRGVCDDCHRTIEVGHDGNFSRTRGW